jgi:uncharacterized protein (DUF697 family)
MTLVQELEEWSTKMSRKPDLASRAQQEIQRRINRLIPEKVHSIITKSIREMTKTVLLGSGLTTREKSVLLEEGFEVTEGIILNRINFYCSSSSVEGAVTGAGGILLGFADFPLWLTLKMKMLFEIASYYGFNIKDYRERIYILYIFQITFSKQQQRNIVFDIMANWEEEMKTHPESINDFDWRTFQIEYRDYLDILKLMQLIPGFGAFVGAYINHKYTKRLGHYAMNAYRLRLKNSIGL